MFGDCLVNGRITWAATLDVHSACARRLGVEGFYAQREHETARL
jgi:hypothetical protein